MQHIIQIKGRYYFNRRVPEIVSAFDKRDRVRIALKTDSKAIAQKNAVMLNEQLEAYWQDLIKANRLHDDAGFKRLVRTARKMGFSYYPVSVVAELPLDQLMKRVYAASEATEIQCEAILGGREEPKLLLSKALDKFFAITKNQIMNKSPSQVRKWENPRKRAVNNFILAIGDKEITEIIRDDIVQFRDWWIDRIKAGNMNNATANKDFFHLKNILQTVAEHLKLTTIDAKHLFRKIRLDDRFTEVRLSFTNEQILTILQSKKLNALNSDARWFLFAAAETGARPAELVGLLPEDIKTNEEVPHISIVDRPGRPLKTAHSARDIPLVGFALEAFKQKPNGFTKYMDKVDSLSTYLNKFLRDHELLPSQQHSLYSFRHSFQDRLNEVNAPERIQCELMGHKYHRPKYGAPSLEQKMIWIEKVKL